ncbi:MAG: ribosome silencing factor [Magnetovibrio sp.]|nr:ribosome silencing factor [Magnetovibrio sp.]
MGASLKARATNDRSVPIAQSKRTPLAGDLLQLVESSLDDDKAENIVVVELSGKTAIADYMVIASGTSQRHVGAMADHIQRRMKGIGLKGIAVEGLKQCDWVLIDAGDLIVHLFRPEVRLFYNLEKIWKNTMSTDITEAQSAGV